MKHKNLKCDKCVNNDGTSYLCLNCDGESSYQERDRFTQDRLFAYECEPKVEPEESEKDPKARYYDAGGIETLDIIKAKLTPEQYKGWLLGNLIKYSCRANFKDQTKRDIEKVKFYGTELFNIL